MAGKPTVVERTERDARTRRKAEMVWYVVLSVIAGLVLFAGFVATAALVPRYCGTCHRPEFRALAETDHEGVHCDACHGSTTVFGLIDERLVLVSMVGSQFVPGRQQIVTTVDNEMCLSCHQKDVAKTTTARRGIRMSHKEVIDANWRCTDCHATTAHAEAQTDQPGYSMDMCLECHSADPGNIKTCEVCHVGKAKSQQGVSAISSWKITHGKNWRMTHGLGNLKTCKACHGTDYCVSCHNIPLPHPDSFAQSHGKEVVSRENGDEDCVVCHDRRACSGCHGLTMPHPEEFVRSHSDEVERAGQAVCGRCHLESSCVDCHTRHAHPGLNKDHIDKLRADPVPVP